VIIPADGKASEELVAKQLGLGHVAEATVEDLLFTTEVSSQIMRPFLPSMFWVREAQMMIYIGVMWTSTPEYPSSASSWVSIKFSSADILRRRYMVRAYYISS
jgi:hypothetical protein